MDRHCSRDAAERISKTACRLHVQIAISLKPSHNDVHWALWLTDANTSNFRHIGQLRNCFITDSGVNVTPFKLDISRCHRLHDFAQLTAWFNVFPWWHHPHYLQRSVHMLL